MAAERFQDDGDGTRRARRPDPQPSRSPAPRRQLTYRVEAPRDGYVESIDTRSVGLAVVALGGGRLRVEDEIDHSVGLTDVVAIGEHVDRDRPLAVVHARSEAEAMIAAQALRVACSIGDVQPSPSPVVASRITD